MKNLSLALIAILMIGFASCTQSNVSTDNIANEADTISYALGMSVGNNLQSQFPDINPDILAAAIIEAYAGKENKIFATNQEGDAAIRAYLQKAQERAGEANKIKGEEFLAENAKREEVKVTESGLQYEVLTQGEGEMPSAENTVSVHYHGTTIDGEVFDSSVERGEPATFPLNGVIKGWTEGVQLMNVGSKYKFYIPSDLAYGARGAGAQIGPHSALIFEVELLEIVK